MYFCACTVSETQRTSVAEDGRSQVAQHNISEGVYSFPYLNYQCLTDRQKVELESELTDETQRMIKLFATTEDSLVVSLGSMQIDILRFKNYVENLISKVGTKKQLKNLQKSETISEIIYALQPFKSFFHYEIIEDIVRVFGSTSDKELMDQYISKFNDFCKRSVFEVPPNVFHESDPKPSGKVFHAKYTTQGQASLIDIVAVRKNLANILRIELIALRLLCITDGCVTLTFLVSVQMAKEIFPLSHSQVSDLSAISLEIVDDPNSSEEEDLVER